MDYTLFLSHTSTDAEVVSEVRRCSEAAGIRIYMYENDVQASVPIAQKLTDAIRTSHGLIAVLTKAGAARPALQQEIGAAVALGKPVYALVEDGVEVAAFALLQGLEYVRLDLDRLGDGMLALQRSIALRREQVRNDVVTALFIALVILGLLYALSRES